MTKAPARRGGRLLVLLLGALATFVAFLPSVPADAQDEGRSKKTTTIKNPSPINWIWHQGQAPSDDKGNTTLTILHNNDGESQLINAGQGLEDFGGAARFAMVVNQQRWKARQIGGVITVSSGDNFLAGPEFNAGQALGTYYDAIALDKIHYDAIALGNHDFDFGPQVLAELINDFKFPGIPPYLSANIDTSNEPVLDALVQAGVIAPYTIVDTQGMRVGIIGAVTPQLPFISSPGNVVVNSDVAGIVQAQIDALLNQGIDKIVLISHLQGIDEDVALAAQLNGVDIMVAGGGDEVLANPGDLLVPGDSAFAEYPIVASDANGNDVPVVTTAGDYKYLGRLVVEFNAAGDVVSFNGGPIRVAGGDNPDAVPMDMNVYKNAVQPVAEFVAQQATNVIATSEVALEGRRAPGIRTQETNEGNLMADALLWTAQQNAAAFGAPVADIGVQNGGGIRNNNLIPAGDITEVTTFDIAPFPNFVVVVPITRDDLKAILENAVSGVEGASGRFAQVAGMSFEYDLAGTPMAIDGDTGAVVTEGTRVTTVTLDDGTVIVANGAVVPGAGLNLATIDFLANGGDQYPVPAGFTRLGASYQQALANYITAPVADGGLGGVISAAQYPEGGEGRIVQTIDGIPAGTAD